MALPISASEPQPIKSKTRGYSTELQSLRGIAALIVVVHHCSFYYAYDTNLKIVSEVFLNAHAAVVLFFVLSGFVLSLSISRHNISTDSVASFYARRAFRLYPLLITGVFLSLLYLYLFHDRAVPQVVSGWWAVTRREWPPTVTSYIYAFLGVQTNLPVPIWTLFIELVGSFIMPFVVMASRRPITLLFAVVASVFTMLTHHFGAWHLGTYLPCFVFGASILPLSQSLKDSTISRRTFATIGVVAAFVMWFGRQTVGADFGHHYDDPVATLIEGLSASVVVLAVWFHGPIPSLRSGIVKRLGDVSYGLYLIHLTIIGLVAGIGGEILRLPIFTGGGLWATAALMCVVVPVSLVFASITYRFIELPGVRLGRHVSWHIEAFARTVVRR